MLKLIRFYKNKEVLGILLLENNFVCFTLENKEKEVPIGKYKLEKDYAGRINDRYKEKLGNEYSILYKLDTSSINRTEILIHIGNYYYDSQGCILVGNGIVFNNGQYSLVYSTNAYKSLYDKLNKIDIEKLYIEITEV
mgnify:CR=1 FL=1